MDYKTAVASYAKSSFEGDLRIKGILEKDGFKSFHTNTAQGWTAAGAEIDENCNKIEIETPVAGIILDIILTRK